jgi:D-glycero-D-manno-heptose 1,7-bisphosphate phosphatase
MLQRAVFLDRDGVLNRGIIKNGKSYPPPSLNELEILPGVPEGLKLLEQAGFLLIGATNQPDVAKGIQKREVVEAINAALMAALPIQEIFVCFHDDPANCACRKPRPGMLLQAAAKYNIHLPTSYMIGDRWKDVEAGKRAGCTTIFIDYKYREKELSVPDYRVASLYEAAHLIINLEKTRREVHETFN